MVLTDRSWKLDAIACIRIFSPSKIAEQIKIPTNIVRQSDRRISDHKYKPRRILRQTSRASAASSGRSDLCLLLMSGTKETKETRAQVKRAK